MRANSNALSQRLPEKKLSDINQLQFQLKAGYNQTLSLVNTTQNPIEVRAFQITTNAFIPSAWGAIGNQWGNVKVSQDTHFFTYTLTLASPVTINPGSTDVLTFSVASSGNKGPFQAAMAPKQMTVQTTGSSDWQLVTAYNPNPRTNPHPDSKFAEYIAQWGIYSYQQGVENAPWSFINSATFCFNGFNTQGDVFSLDPNADYTQLPLLGMQKQMNPYLDFALSFGGWTNADQRMNVIFSQMASNPVTRANFVKNAVNAAAITGANGIDIDWEYVEKEDVSNFIALLKELRSALPQGAKLTIAAPAGIEKIKNFTPEQWQTVAATVDEIRIMAYDFFGGFSAISDFHAAWQLSPNSPNFNSGYSTQVAINTYLQTMRVSAKKLSWGIPNYGRAVIVDDVGQYAGLYQPVVGTPQGDFQGANGVYSWKNIYNLLNNQPSALDQLGVKQWNFYDSNYPLCRDAKMCLLTGQLPTGQWVVLNFLDQASSRWRGEQAKKMGFGGTMMWANYSETTDLNNSIAQAVSAGMQGYAVEKKLGSQQKVNNELAKTSHLLASATLTNYLGTGENPNLQLVLGDNGPGWKSYTIGYKGTANVPFSKEPSRQWSTWLVQDELNNYYGAITLQSDGVNEQWVSYSAAKGYYLEGIHFTYNAQSGAYQLTVDKIFKPAQTPFPDAPRATPAVYHGTKTPIKLTVKGDKILDDFGNKMIFKGMVRPSLEWNRQGQFLSVQDIKNIASWGSNVIRLDLNQNYWFESATVDTPGSYKQIIDAIIYYATENGMAVILDLHWTVNGQQSPMANRQSLQFWKEVANAYKDFGTVIFELFNEPYQIKEQVWLTGSPQYAGYQELYDAVRATGANNLVIVGGLDWAYDLSFIDKDFCVQGSNIIYCSHPYNNKGTKEYKGQGGNFNNCYKGIIGNYPLIFTEFGVDKEEYFPSGYKQIYQNALDYINSVDGHYTGFAWWLDRNSFPSLIADWNGTPVNGGVLIKNDMQQHQPTNFFKPKQLQIAFEEKKPQQPIQKNNSVPLTPVNYKQLAVEELLKIQDKFKLVKQAKQRKNVIESCMELCTQLEENSATFQVINDIILNARQTTLRAHQAQWHAKFSFGLFSGQCRTVEALDNLLIKLKGEHRHSCRGCG